MDSIWRRVTFVAVLLAVAVIGCAKSSVKSMFQREPPVTPEMAESVSLTIWHESYEAAVQESQRTGKPILADFTGSDWCHYCVQLKKEVFESSEFQKWAKDNVVLLELDFPKRSQQAQDIKQQNQELAKRYQIKGYPTVLFLDAGGQVLGRMGYQNNPSQWIAKAQSQLPAAVSVQASTPRNLK